MPDKSRVLVVGTTPDYIDWIRRAAPGRAVFLTQSDVRRSATESAPAADEEALCDLADTNGAQRALENHLSRHRIKLEGVACFDCESMELAARLAGVFGLPYPSPKSILLCRDKSLQKRAWRKSGVLCPRARLIREPAEALAFLQQIGGKCVLKPLTGSGSELVFLATGQEECREQLLRIQTGLDERQNSLMYRHGFVDGAFAVAEEYIEGTEYSCDFLKQNGRADILRLARKHRAAGKPFGTIRAYETVAELPGGKTHEELAAVLSQAADALGVAKAICMVDFMLRGDEIVLLEMTPRPGGDCLPGLLRAAAGFDILTLTLDFASGRDFSPVALNDFVPCVGLRIHATRPGRLLQMQTNGLREDPRIFEVAILRQPGQEIRMPPRDYTSWLLGHVIFRSDGVSDIPAQCDEILKSITITMEPS